MKPRTWQERLREKFPPNGVGIGPSDYLVADYEKIEAHFQQELDRLREEAVTILESFDESLESIDAEDWEWNRGEEERMKLLKKAVSQLKGEV